MRSRVAPWVSFVAAASLAVAPLQSARAQESTWGATLSDLPPPAASPPPPVDVVNERSPVAPSEGAAAPTSFDEGPHETRRIRGRWYGWQTLAFDGVALATLSISNSVTASKIAFATYALGPLLVHIGHGRMGIGIADTLLRIGAPAVLGAAFFALGSLGSHGGDGDAGYILSITGMALGVIGGVATAVSVDAAVLAREPPPSATKTGVVWSPTIAPQKGGATFGLGGAF